MTATPTASQLQVATEPSLAGAVRPLTGHAVQREHKAATGSIAALDPDVRPVEFEVFERLRAIAADDVRARYADIDRANRLHRDDIDILLFLSSAEAEAGQSRS